MSKRSGSHGIAVRLTMPQAEALRALAMRGIRDLRENYQDTPVDNRALYNLERQIETALGTRFTYSAVSHLRRDAS